MAEYDWFSQVIADKAGTNYRRPSTMQSAYGAYQAPQKVTLGQARPIPGAATDLPVSSPSPMDIPRMRPAQLGGTPGEISRFRNLQKGFGPGASMPGQEELPTEDGPSGPSGPSVSSVFAPLFDALNQQRRNAESRYGANAGQIQNIYGQIIGARRADVDDIQEAYSRLQAAAAARGESTLGKMEQREMQRQAESQQVLGSMGVGDIASATDNVATESAAVARDVELMNQSNWAGMLDVMGKTSEELARADVTSYGYRQMEDIAKLQGAKEDYLNEVANQEFELKFQEQQAKLAAAQAAAQAKAEAEAAAAKQQAEAQQLQSEQTLDYLRTADPLTRAVGEEAFYRGLSPQDRAAIETAYRTFLADPEIKLGQYGTTAQEALARINSDAYAGQLSPQASATLAKAVLYTFSQ